MTNPALPRSRPQDVGLDPAAVTRLLDAFAAADLELHSLMVLRRGQVVAEGWWAPYESTEISLLYSLSKSFTSTAIGLAVHEGLLSTDDLVTSFFPDLLPTDVSPRAARLTVRHLLTMSTGHREDTLERLDRRALVPSYLSLAPEQEPGTWFTYNNGATMMLSAIVTELTGQRLLDYLRPRLLAPLGITQANWQGVNVAGTPPAPDQPLLDLGFTGLHLTTESLAAFGQLYLQQGFWQGRQLVPREWVEEATQAQVDNPREPNPDWRRGYGYQFWMGRDGYRGDGAFGQLCLVLPEDEAVVVATAATESMQSLLDCIWSELVPAFRVEVAPDAGAAAEAELAARLRSLALPLSKPSHAGPVAVATPWLAPASSEQVRQLRVSAIDDIASGWRLTLTDDQGSFDVDCGRSDWLRSVVELQPGFNLKLAVRGGWSDKAVFTAEVVAVQTPHRLTLTCDCSAGATSVEWNVQPLRVPSLRTLAVDVHRY